jgi:hypothetical protein
METYYFQHQQQQLAVEAVRIHGSCAYPLVEIDLAKCAKKGRAMWTPVEVFSARMELRVGGPPRMVTPIA